MGERSYYKEIFCFLSFSPPKNKIRNSMGISSFIDGGGSGEIGDFIRSATHMSAALENVYRGVRGGGG